MKNSETQQYEEEQHIYQLISQPNPIQKKTLVSPRTIFPQKQLPQFTFTEQPEQTWQSQSTFKKEIMEFQENSFAQLFKQPIYRVSNRIKTGKNSEFGMVQAKAQQAKVHSPLISSDCSVGVSFESRFQSGNLAFAAKSQKQGNQFYTLLHKDINTRKCTQWFFFEVKNNQIIGEATFHILNFVKSYSAFENGMKIAYASKNNNYKWMRGCKNIKYRKTNISQNNNRNYYALSFTYKFERQSQSVYFAYSYPYTFSMLDKFLLNLSNNYSNFVKRKTLAYSPSNNYVDLLTITNHQCNENPNKKPKKVVFITSRVHPGETPASFVMQGLIKFLISNTPEADLLRNFFVFKLVPMLNPDGVVNGNYRCSLSGNDLNRVWHRADKDYHPQIYYARKQILEIGKIFMYIDLHAHSKKKGIFMYGCQNRNNPYVCRQIPFILWKNVPHFNYYQCKFSFQVGREGTSRLSIWRSMGVDYCYTMEHSFCGPIKSKVHFTTENYCQVGKNLGLTLCKYFCKMREQNQPLEQLLCQLYNNKDLLKVGDKQGDSSSSDEQLEPIKSKIGVQEDPQSPRKLIVRRQRNPIKLVKKSVSDSETNLMAQTTRIRSNSPQKMGSTRYNSDFYKFGNRAPQEELPLPIVNPEFRFYKKQIRNSNQFIKFRGAYSSLAKKTFKDEDSKEPTQVVIINRFAEQQLNSLSDLFLPSLKTVSYKKYGRNKRQNGIIQIGKPLSERSCILKDEIKKVEKKKLNLKDKILQQLRLCGQ